MVRTKLLTACALSSLLGLVYGYSTGAPPDQCDQMSPSHDAVAQTGPSPYTIHLSAYKFSCPGQEITVTINGKNTFQGFLCQPRPDLNKYTTSGSLNASGNVPMKNNCGTYAALTHTEDSSKSDVSFVWKAADDKTSVQIVCTIVQSFDVFWVKTTSATVSYVAGKCPGGSSGATKSILNLPIYIVPALLFLHFIKSNE